MGFDCQSTIPQYNNSLLSQRERDPSRAYEDSPLLVLYFWTVLFSHNHLPSTPYWEFWLLETDLFYTYFLALSDLLHVL